MKKSVGLHLVFLTVATMTAICAIPVMAQDRAPAKAATKRQSIPTKVLFENDRVRVQEVTFKPGDQGPGILRPFRVIRVLEGGTMRRAYADGTVQTIVYKTGEVIAYEADEQPYVPRNVGKSYIVFYVVALKDPKQ